MRRLSKTYDAPARRNPIAAALRSTAFKQRIVRDRRHSPRRDKDKLRQSLNESSSTAVFIQPAIFRCFAKHRNEIVN